MVSGDRLHQILRRSAISPKSEVDVATLRRLAEFTNAETVVYGQYVKSGSRFASIPRCSTCGHDSSSTLKTDVASEKDLITAVDGLAQNVGKSWRPIRRF